MKAARPRSMIDIAREEYRPSPSRGSILYFVVADMGGVDPMYQYSLPWFVNLFVSRSTSRKSPTTTCDERLATLNDYLHRLELYTNICRALFEAHKLLFSFSICIKIMQARQADRRRRVALLPLGLDLGRASTTCPEAGPSWLDRARVVGRRRRLAELPAFVGIEKSVAAERRRRGAGVPRLERAALGEGARRVGREAQRLPEDVLVLRCVRPDKVVFGMQRSSPQPGRALHRAAAV